MGAQIISLETCMKDKERWAEMLRTSIIVYPTDTVYGLGCDAENKKLVERIYEIKKRDKSKPMSVIAPSFSWILENCVVDKKIEYLHEYLPGPYTVLLKKRNHSYLSHVTSNTDVIGVRVPDHPFTEIVTIMDAPFITTSANISRQRPVASIKELDDNVVNNVDLIIDGGTLMGKPSTIVDFTGSKPKIVERE